MEQARTGLPEGRHWAIDDQGVALRATWRLDHGFINLSLWRHDQCVATFHLTPSAAGELIAFLAHGLADATSVATMAPVTAISDRATARRTLAHRAAQRRHELRDVLARVLEAAARRVKVR